MAESKRFLLRLDPRVFEALRRWAQDDLRSINGQIEYLLTEQARKAGRLPHAPHRRYEPPRDVPSDDEDDSIDSEEPAASQGR
ncbi:MAG TPA: hypothetical protein VNV17_23720 [Solirubrobacteraceae bacterium]|jgi:hypothetical protein|nr:hypothetical protein [Solirubrobacteraceae bacterium]